MNLALAAVLLASATVASAHAQSESQFEEISGTYANTEAGIEVTFPAGWSGGGAGNSQALQAFVVPGGFDETEPAKIITLLMGPMPAPSDPIDPSGFVEFYIGDCDAPSVRARTVSGVQGIEVDADCPAIESAGRMVAVAAEGRLVLMIYEAPSSEFEADLGSFDAAVESLKVEGAIDSPLGTGAVIKTTFVQVVTIGEELVDLKFVTSVGVLDLELDEDARALSFKVNGTDESTVVLVGAILEGPYVVTIDGEEAGFEETVSYPGVSTISLPHGEGEHEIVITGTQVVPEFPAALVAAASIGTAVVVGRTRFTRLRI